MEVFLAILPVKYALLAELLYFSAGRVNEITTLRVRNINIKDVDDKYGELCEIVENLKRPELSFGNQSRHIARREELMMDLGLAYQQGDNRFTKTAEKVSLEDMATGIGLSKRSYQQRKQLMRINEELMDLLINAGKVILLLNW